MRIPQIFVPEKVLENKIKDYLEPRTIHEDPNLIYIRSFIKVSKVIPGVEDPSDILVPFDKAYRELKRTAKVCIHTIDFFKILGETPYTYQLQKEDMLSVFLNAKERYKKRIKNHISITMLLEDESVIQNGVMDYVNMIIGLSDEHRQGQSWKYMDPKTKLPKTITIDMNYVLKVEKQLWLTKIMNAESFRRTIIKIYGTKLSNDPYYDFMDNLELVDAVTNVKLESEVAKAGSLVRALASMSNEENKRTYERITNNMIKHHGYCNVCAERTIEHFCTQKN